MRRRFTQMTVCQRVVSRDLRVMAGGGGVPTAHASVIDHCCERLYTRRHESQMYLSVGLSDSLQEIVDTGKNASSKCS